MNMITVSLNLPRPGSRPQDYAECIKQAMYDAQNRGDVATAQAIGGLLQAIIETAKPKFPFPFGLR